MMAENITNAVESNAVAENNTVPVTVENNGTPVATDKGSKGKGKGASRKGSKGSKGKPEATKAPDKGKSKEKAPLTAETIVSTVKADRKPSGPAAWHNQKLLLSAMTLILGRGFDASNGSASAPEYAWDVTTVAPSDRLKVAQMAVACGKLLGLKVGISGTVKLLSAAMSYDADKVHVGIICESDTAGKVFIVFAY